MAESMGFENVKLFDPRDLLKIAAFHLRIFVQRVKSGKDAEGTTFPKYTDKYAKMKSGRMTGKKGRLKRYKGISITSSQVSPPDFTLTGLTLRGLRVRAHDSHSYTLGWEGEPAEIVQGNAGRHRDIMSGVPDGEVSRVVELLGNAVDQELKTKLKNITVHVKV